MRKISLLITVLILLMSVIFIPNFSNAETREVNNEETLRSAIESSSEGDIIKLTTDISLSKPLELSEENITIDGDGFSISKNESDWSTTSSNGSLITAGISAKLTLSNITLKNSEKYGVQAYNGGYVVLDGVTISDCGYGGVLVNAGTVEIRNLSLGHNGLEASNNGIEIAKGREIDDSHGSNQPKLIMNGSLESTETTNVIYLASNDDLTEFEIENTENTINKVLVSGNKVVVTDENNDVIFESNENDKIQLEGETFAQNITITINLMDQTTTVVVPEGTLLTAEELTAKIDLSVLGLSDYTLTGFFTDPEYTAEVDFTIPITTNVTIYAKLDLNEVPDNNVVEEKDETPKTGIENNIYIVLFALATSTIILITFKRKGI